MPAPRVVLPDDLRARRSRRAGPEASSGPVVHHSRLRSSVSNSGAQARGGQLPARGDRPRASRRPRPARPCAAPAEPLDRALGVVVGGAALGVGRRRRSRRPRAAARARRTTRARAATASRGGRAAPLVSRRRTAGNVAAGASECAWRATLPSSRMTSTGAAAAVAAVQSVHARATRTQRIVRRNAINPMLGSPAAGQGRLQRTLRRIALEGAPRHADPPATPLARPRRCWRSSSPAAVATAAAARPTRARASTTCSSKTFSGEKKVESGKLDLTLDDRRPGRLRLAAPGPDLAQALRPVPDPGQGQAAQVRHRRRLRGRGPEPQGRA